MKFEQDDNANNRKDHILVVLMTTESWNDPSFPHAELIEENRIQFLQEGGGINMDNIYLDISPFGDQVVYKDIWRELVMQSGLSDYTPKQGVSQSQNQDAWEDIFLAR